MINTENEDEENTFIKRDSMVLNSPNPNEKASRDEDEHDMYGNSSVKVQKRHNDEGPKMARNMGFPDMKYLDPEQHGPPIKEETFYKENIKHQREGQFLN